MLQAMQELYRLLNKIAWTAWRQKFTPAVDALAARRRAWVIEFLGKELHQAAPAFHVRFHSPLLFPAQVRDPLDTIYRHLQRTGFST